MKRICPSCYRHNKAWVLYAKCPFCGTPGRPIPEVVGLDWPMKVRDMLLATETDLSRTYTLQHARRGLLPTVADLGSDTRTRSGKGPRAALEATEATQEGSA